MLQTGTKSYLYFISAAYLCFFAGGCGEYVSRRNKDSFSLLSGGRNFGYDIRRLPVHIFRRKYYRARLTGFSAFGVPYGPCGGVVCRLLHKKQAGLG